MTEESSSALQDATEMVSCEGDPLGPSSHVDVANTISDIKHLEVKAVFDFIFKIKSRSLSHLTFYKGLIYVVFIAHK